MDGEKTIEQPCKYERVIGEILARLTNIEEDIKDIKDNHLNSIYSELRKSGAKPTWLISNVITFLASVLTGLIVGVVVAFVK